MIIVIVKVFEKCYISDQTSNISYFSKLSSCEIVSYFYQVAKTSCHFENSFAFSICRLFHMKVRSYVCMSFCHKH